MRTRRTVLIVLLLTLSCRHGALVTTATKPAPTGWASVAGEGVKTTTGGEGGPTVTVTSFEELESYATADGPYVIRVAGTISGITRVASNKTIEGLSGALLEGGLEIEGDDRAFVSNVIVRNLTVRMTNCPGDGCTDKDAIRIFRAHHVWIDHCDISDGDDGNLDITAESDYVTVSWNRFGYSDDSGKLRISNLVGASDRSTEDANDLRVTFHHNWWTENVAERMPRVRFGKVHLFNNYYTPNDDVHCIRPMLKANLLVENNYFEGVNKPFDSPHPTARIRARGNAFGTQRVAEPVQGWAFKPPYEYTLDATEDVPAIVRAGAGPATSRRKES